MKGVYKRGNKWWIRYRVNGQLIRRAAGYDKRQAEDALAAVRGDLVRGTYKLRGKSEIRTFSEMVTEYLEDKADKRSLSRDRVSFKSLMPEFQHLELNQITVREIEAYIKKRKRSVSGATINRELALLKCLFNLAIRSGYTERNPVREVKRCQEAAWRTKYVFSEAEMHKLINAAAPHLQPILWLAFGTGLRKGDILGLKWKDVDLDRGIISLVMQKTGEIVEIPLLLLLREILAQMKKSSSGSEYVFTSAWPSRKAGQHTRLIDIKTGFKAALRRSGLADKGYRFHDIRRSFATLIYKRGAGLTAVQRLLGHKSVLTTERYLGLKFEEVRQAVMLLDSALSSAIEAEASSRSAKMPSQASISPQLPEHS